MRNVLDKRCRENENTHFIFSNVFRKWHRLWDNVEKYSVDRGARNDVTTWRIRVACWISKSIRTYSHARVHAPVYPHARTRKHAHTDQYVTHCLSTATMVSWTRLIVTLYVHWLYCYILSCAVRQSLCRTIPNEYVYKSELLFHFLFFNFRVKIILFLQAQYSHSFPTSYQTLFAKPVGRVYCIWPAEGMLNFPSVESPPSCHFIHMILDSRYFWQFFMTRTSCSWLYPFRKNQALECLKKKLKLYGRN